MIKNYWCEPFLSCKLELPRRDENTSHKILTSMYPNRHSLGIHLLAEETKITQVGLAAMRKKISVLRRVGEALRSSNEENVTGKKKRHQ